MEKLIVARKKWGLQKSGKMKCGLKICRLKKSGQMKCLKKCRLKKSGLIKCGLRKLQTKNNVAKKMGPNWIWIILITSQKYFLAKLKIFSILKKNFAK